MTHQSALVPTVAANSGHASPTMKGGDGWGGTGAGLNASMVQQQIHNLLLSYPELAEDDVLRADMIEGCTGLHEFLGSVEFIRQDAATLAGAIAAHIATLEDRQARFERREQKLRELMCKLLQAANLRKVELPEATLSVRACPPKVIITDEAILPPYYTRTKTEPDKSLIGAALKAGQQINGATLSNQEPTLSIRTR